MWMLDTHEIEGTNNTLKHVAKIAPGIEWDLLSTRTTLRKYLSMLLALSDPAQEEQSFAERCIEHHADAMNLLAEDKATRCRFGVVDSDSYPLVQSYMLFKPDKKPEQKHADD
eukprot:1802188-Karenia_brevis.AAC.1